MRKEDLGMLSIGTMPLACLNDYVYKEYETEKEPIEATLTRPFKDYEIHQKQFDGCSGLTDVSIHNAHIEINWQAFGAHIEVDNVTKDVLDFLRVEIVDVYPFAGSYFFVNGESIDDFIKSNIDIDLNTFTANEDAVKNNKKISLETYMKMYPEHKKLYEDMRRRYQTKHTVKMWERLVKNTEERLAKPETEASLNIKYYLKFKCISKEAADLFNEYIGKIHSISNVKAASDKDMKDYILEVIRAAMEDFAGVSYNIDKEAFTEICKLRKDEFEANRLNIFKDVKHKVVKHFEDLGFILSERNLSSIDWWINNYNIRY